MSEQKQHQVNQIKFRQVAKTRLLSGCEVEVQVHAGVLEVPEVDSRNHHRSPRSPCSPVQVKTADVLGNVGACSMFPACKQCIAELSKNLTELLIIGGHGIQLRHSGDLVTLLFFGSVFQCYWECFPALREITYQIDQFQFQLRPFVQKYATCGLISVPFAGASFCFQLLSL